MQTKVGLVAVAVAVVLALTGQAPARAALTSNGQSLQGASEDSLVGATTTASGGATAVVVELPTDGATSR